MTWVNRDRCHDLCRHTEPLPESNEAAHVGVGDHGVGLVAVVVHSHDGDASAWTNRAPRPYRPSMQSLPGCPIIRSKRGS
jgi:hypothetical protein